MSSKSDITHDETETVHAADEQAESSKDDHDVASPSQSQEIELSSDETDGGVDISLDETNTACGDEAQAGSSKDGLCEKNTASTGESQKRKLSTVNLKK